MFQFMGHIKKSITTVSISYTTTSRHIIYRNIQISI